MKLSPKPRQNAIQFLSYIHSILDIEKMAKDEGPQAMKVYQSAMIYFEETLGNKKYVLLEPHDIEFMSLVKEKGKTIKEISIEMSVSEQKARAYVTKLISKSLISIYPSKLNKEKVNLYKLTPYGDKRLTEEKEKLNE